MQQKRIQQAANSAIETRTRCAHSLNQNINLTQHAEAPPERHSRKAAKPRTSVWTTIAGRGADMLPLIKCVRARGYSWKMCMRQSPAHTMHNYAFRGFRRPLASVYLSHRGYYAVGGVTGVRAPRAQLQSHSVCARAPPHKTHSYGLKILFLASTRAKYVVHASIQSHNIHSLRARCAKKSGRFLGVRRAPRLQCS